MAAADLAPVMRQALSVNDAQYVFPAYPDAAVFRALDAFKKLSFNISPEDCAVLEELGRWGYVWSTHPGADGKHRLLVDVHGCNKPAGQRYDALLADPAAHNPYKRLEMKPEGRWRDPSEPTQAEMNRLLGLRRTAQ